MGDVITCRTCRLPKNDGPIHMRCSCDGAMVAVVLQLPPLVEIVRRAPVDGGLEHVSTFAGGATDISVVGPVMTIEASDVDGVRFTIVLTQRTLGGF